MYIDSASSKLYLNNNNVKAMKNKNFSQGANWSKKKDEGNILSNLQCMSIYVCTHRVVYQCMRRK